MPQAYITHRRWISYRRYITRSCQGTDIIEKRQVSVETCRFSWWRRGEFLAVAHALAVSLAGKVRVNSVSPGWIDTACNDYDGPDALQQPVGRVGTPSDIANAVLYLCSDMAGFITGRKYLHRRRYDAPNDLPRRSRLESF